MVNLLSIADGITLLNAILGFLALLMVFSHQFALAASFILLGLLADGLDGLVARFIGNGKLGEFLEAIADMVSLSVAPLALVYAIYYDAITSEMFVHLLVGIVLVFSLVCSIIRLSSFSLLRQKQSFVGLPTSASAIFLVIITYLKPGIWYVLPAIVILSLAMVSSLGFPKPGLKVNLIAAVFIVVTILLDSMYGNIAPLLLLVALSFYIVVGPIYLQVKKRRTISGTGDTRN